MRLNRSTLLLLLVSVLVIAAVLFLSRDEAQEQAIVTPVVDETSGPLLPGLAEADVASVALQDNARGDFIRLTREGDGGYEADIGASRTQLVGALGR